jgi:spermidine synthase
MVDYSPAADVSTPPRAFEPWVPPLILLLFVGSGAAALIYEIVWFQLLQLVIGSSSVSLGVLLGTFMGGMCLGSLLLPRLVAAHHHPLRVYALIELAIGGVGLLVLFLMPLVGVVYTAWGGYGFSGFLMRGIVAALVLLPPTFLMGATLPAVSRWIETTPAGVSWLGFFYGANIAGAVFGCLLAGFYLLRVFDMATATYVAVAINAIVAAVGLALSSMKDWSRSGDQAAVPPAAAPGPDVAAPNAGDRTNRLVYVAIALSGLCAMAAEVIWTRELGLLFGATVYTFSLILAVFLVGLGLGSSVGSLLARNLARPAIALGICQLLAAASITWASYMLAESLPYWPVNPSISSNIWFNFQLDLARAFWTVLPASMMWGASFPLALAAVARQGRDPGKLVGGLYAANTLGAIIGGLSASLLLVALIGSQRAQQLIVLLSATSGLLALVAAPDRTGAPRGSKTAIAVPVSIALAALLIWSTPATSWLLVAYGRYAATWVGQSEIIYMGEGVNSSVAVSQLSSGVLNYHNAGKVQASSEPQDMRLQRTLGHFTTLLARDPQSVVVIGCGAGVTAGAVSIDPRVKRVTIAEIEPLVPYAVSTYFAKHNFDVIRNPKVQVRIDDARHYILTTREKFDALTSDPLDPWVKGAASLYTREFLEAVKARLNPGGTVTLFVQLYESSPEAVKSEIGTFFEVFPNGMIWGNTHEGRGYDTVLFGTVDPIKIDVDEMEARLKRPEYKPIAKSLEEIGYPSARQLFSTFAARRSDLTEYLKDAPINRDENLRLQYVAGLGLNRYEAGSIYNDILRNRRYPEDLFTGSPENLQYIRSAMNQLEE